MAHGSHSSRDNSKSLELGYQEDDVQVNTLVKFLVGLAAFIFISFALMYGLKMALEYQMTEEDKAAASPMAMPDPMAMTQDERGMPENHLMLPPEPRVQAAPGFGVTLRDGKRVNLENQAPQAEYWTLRKEWDEVLEKGDKDAKTGMVIALPIEAAKKKYLEAKPPMREGAKEAMEIAPPETSAGRNPGEKAMAEAPEGAAMENKEAGAKPEAMAKPTAAAAPKAAAASAGKRP